MAESLKKLETMRQEFVSNVSHEIQSPLTSITGFARALRDEGLAGEQRHRYLAIIEAESARLSRLSDNLLKLSALDARTRLLEPKAYRLDAQLRAVVLACEPQWKEKGVQVSAELDALTVTADRGDARPGVGKPRPQRDQVHPVGRLDQDLPHSMRRGGSRARRRFRYRARPGRAATGVRALLQGGQGAHGGTAAAGSACRLRRKSWPSMEGP